MVLPLSVTWFTWLLTLLAYDFFPHLYVLPFSRIWLLPQTSRVLIRARRLICKRMILVIKSRVVFVNPWKPKAIWVWVSDRNCWSWKFKSWKIILCVVELIAIIISWVLFHQYHVFVNVCRRNDFESKSYLMKLFLNSLLLMLFRIWESKLWASGKHVQKEEKDHTWSSPNQTKGHIFSVLK